MVTMTRKEFEVFSKDCDEKDNWKCKKTKYACKDYMCYQLKEEATNNYRKSQQSAKTVKQYHNCKRCDSDMAVQILIKVHKFSECPKCRRKLK